MRKVFRSLGTLAAFLALGLMVAVALVGCGGEKPGPDPTPVPTVVPTEVPELEDTPLPAVMADCRDTGVSAGTGAPVVYNCYGTTRAGSRVEANCPPTTEATLALPVCSD